MDGITILFEKVWEALVYIITRYPRHPFCSRRTTTHQFIWRQQKWTDRRWKADFHPRHWHSPSWNDPSDNSVGSPRHRCRAFPLLLAQTRHGPFWGLWVWRRTDRWPCCPAMSNPPTSSWTAWPDGSGRWDNRMAAQHLPARCCAAKQWPERTAHTMKKNNMLLVLAQSCKRFASAEFIVNFLRPQRLDLDGYKAVGRGAGFRTEEKADFRLVASRRNRTRILICQFFNEIVIWEQIDLLVFFQSRGRIILARRSFGIKYLTSAPSR